MKNQQVHLNIPVAHFESVLSWDKETIDHLVKRAIEIAVKVGIRLDDDREGIYLKEAEAKGARIDWDSSAVMFTTEQIEESIAVLRNTLPATDPLSPMSICEGGRDEHFGVGNGANLMFDYDNWTAKPPTVQDLIELCQWAQGNDDVSLLFPPVMLKDIDQRLSAIYSYALISKYCHKTVLHEQPTEPIHVRYLQKMAKVYEKHRGYFQPMQEWEYVNPPFRMGRRSIATMLERVDSGACTVMGVGPMSVSGMSAPVTVAGLAVTALAEILTGLTLFRILRPGYGLRTNVCTGSLDLRTARVSYFGMHTHLCNLATWELLARGIGIQSHCLTWYRDANEPGMQALYEFGMGQTFHSSTYTRAHPEIGGLCNGNIFSPHQAVLDIELVKEFNELASGFEVSEEMLGVEEVIEARFEQGYHMGSEHTVANKEHGIPFSKFLYRGLSAGAQHDKNHNQAAELMEKAEQAVEAATAKGRSVEPDNTLAEEMYEYVKEAAAELGIEAPPLL